MQFLTLNNMEELEPTYESIYEKINAKRALLWINEKDFTMNKRKKAYLNAHRAIIISHTWGCMYR